MGKKDFFPSIDFENERLNIPQTLWGREGQWGIMNSQIWKQNKALRQCRGKDK